MTYLILLRASLVKRIAVLPQLIVEQVPLLTVLGAIFTSSVTRHFIIISNPQYADFPQACLAGHWTAQVEPVYIRVGLQHVLRKHEPFLRVHDKARCDICRTELFVVGDQCDRHGSEIILKAYRLLLSKRDITTHAVQR